MVVVLRSEVQLLLYMPLVLAVGLSAERWLICLSCIRIFRCDIDCRSGQAFGCRRRVHQIDVVYSQPDATRKGNFFSSLTLQE